MSKLTEMQAAIALAASTGANMTEAQKGGGGGRLLPAGYAFGRLVSYVEQGNQPQSFNGVAKDPKPQAQIGFALTGEGYTNEDGSPYLIYPYAFSLDRNEKAKAYLLFKALNWKGTATHFAQLLGEGFLVNIVHEPKSKADKALVSRINLKGFLPPLDPVTKMPYAIAEARDEDLQLFLWDYPTLEAWNSMFIEGAWDDGRSKNFMQETLAGATNFSGSPLEALLRTAGAAIPVAAPKAAVVAPALPATPAAPVAPAVAAAVPLVQAVAPAPVPVAPPVILAPASVGVPALPVMPAVTSRISVAPPAMPMMPSLPTFQQPAMVQ